METTFVRKMERDYKAKCDEANEKMKVIIKMVDTRLESMTILCNTQMDEIHNRQQEVVDENNRLHRDIESMKQEIVALQSSNEKISPQDSTPRTENIKVEIPQTNPTFIQQYPILSKLKFARRGYTKS